MNGRGPGPRHTFEFLIERLEAFVQRRRWELNDANRIAEWARLRAAPQGSGGSRGTAAASSGGSDRTAAEAENDGATAAPAAAAPPSKDAKPLNSLVAPLRATKGGPKNMRLCLFYVSGKCNRETCDFWHPTADERSFTTDEVEAAHDFCGRPRDYTRGGKKSVSRSAAAK